MKALVLKLTNAVLSFLKSEATRKFVIELVAEIAAETITKFIGGGADGPQTHALA